MLGLVASTSGGAKPGQQGFESRAVRIGKHHESQAESIAAFYVANDGIRFDAAFLNQEIEFGGHALSNAGLRHLDEKAVIADVENTRNVIASIATPANPDVFDRTKSR